MAWKVQSIFQAIFVMIDVLAVLVCVLHKEFHLAAAQIIVTSNLMASRQLPVSAIASEIFLLFGKDQAWIL